MGASDAGRRAALPALVVGGSACAFGTLIFLARSGPFASALWRLAVALGFAWLVVLASVGCAAALELGLARVLGARSRGPGLHSVIVGMPLFGTLCFLLSLATTGPLWMGSALFVADTIAVVTLWRHRRPLTRSWTLDVAGGVALGLLAIAFGLELVVAQLPPTSLDELAYHLRVPKAWVLAGHFVELPLNSHSYFPTGIESTYLPLFALAGPLGGQSARLLHWITGCVVVAIMARWLARRLPLGSALVCVVVWVATPCLFLATGVALVEWNLLGVCLLAWIGLEAWIDRGDADEVPMALVWAAGLATKYTFVPYALILGAAGAWLLRRRPADARRWWVTGAAGVVLGAPFFVRNLVLTGNPIEPLGGADTANVMGFMAESSVAAQSLRYVFDASRVDESLGAALPAAALCGLWGAWATRGASRLPWLALAMWVPLGILASQGVVARILLPFLLVPAMVGLLAVQEGAARGTWASRTVPAAWLLLAAVQIVTAASIIASEDPYAYFFSGRDAYVAKRKAYAGLAWLDGQLPRDSRTLVVGLQELYPSERIVHGAGNSDGARVGRYLDATSADALSDRLVSDGFTHVATYFPRILVVDAPRVVPGGAERFTLLTQRQAAVLREMLERDATRIAGQKEWSLHRLAVARKAN